MDMINFDGLLIGIATFLIIGLFHPVVVKAKVACPFEDCGGLYGYYHILKVLEDPVHEEYEETAEWLENTGYTADEFDPAFYDAYTFRPYEHSV